MLCINEFGQPIGDVVPNWEPCPSPEPITLTGRYCRIEQFDVSKHADDLYAAYSHDDGRMWTYLFDGPFETAEEFRRYADKLTNSIDPRHYAVIDLSTGKAVGTMSLMRIKPANGTIEVGYIAFSPLLKQSIQSTEAQYLLMAYVFEQLGYIRYEWKCHSLNAPSRKAAIRLGFTFEGIFEKHMIIKGRSRSTAWFAITNDRWPVLKTAFQSWLNPNNFQTNGQQIRKLEDFHKN